MTLTVVGVTSVCWTDVSRHNTISLSEYLCVQTGSHDSMILAVRDTLHQAGTNDATPTTTTATGLLICLLSTIRLLIEMTK